MDKLDHRQVLSPDSGQHRHLLLFALKFSTVHFYLVNPEKRTIVTKTQIQQKIICYYSNNNVLKSQVRDLFDQLCRWWRSKINCKVTLSRHKNNCLSNTTKLTQFLIKQQR